MGIECLYSWHPVFRMYRALILNIGPVISDRLPLRGVQWLSMIIGYVERLLILLRDIYIDVVHQYRALLYIVWYLTCYSFPCSSPSSNVALMLRVPRASEGLMMKDGPLHRIHISVLTCSSFCTSSFHCYQLTRPRSFRQFLPST